MGFLGAFTNGASIVFPSDNFDPASVLDAIENEQCTILLGVPTMFLAELDENKKRKRNLNSLRTGLAAGSSVPLALMNRLEKEMNVKGIPIAYGMTETSPVTFMTSFNDTQERRLSIIGRVIAHTQAKILGSDGKVAPLRSAR